MSHWGAENQHSEGEMEPDICDTEPHVQGRIRAAFVCRETEECCVHVNWWVNHYADNTQAVSFLVAVVRAEGESAVTSGM